jgi:hypothetical protein
MILTFDPTRPIAKIHRRTRQGPQPSAETIALASELEALMKNDPAGMAAIRLFIARHSDGGGHDAWLEWLFPH